MVLAVTSEIVFAERAGQGIAVAVLGNATIVRAMFVAPRPLAGLHARLGLREGEAATT